MKRVATRDDRVSRAVRAISVYSLGEVGVLWRIGRARSG